MGTPEFALPTLRRIHQSRHRLTAVVTQPDRPRGRGRKLSPTPVKQFALDNSLSPVFQPERMKDRVFLQALSAVPADVFVVVAFRILPEAVFCMPPRGTVNLHPSLLPRYRGAAPLNWTIINGETTTGLTTIFIRKEVDAGNIILQRETPVYETDTAGTLHDRLMEEGAGLMIETLDMIAANTVTPLPQDDSLASPAPRLTREMCRLDFEQPAGVVNNWIRGLSPVPGAFAYLGDHLVKFYRSRVVAGSSREEPPGTIVKATGRDLWIACRPGMVAVEELQIQGRKRLSTAEFLRGVELERGWKFH